MWKVEDTGPAAPYLLALADAIAGRHLDRFPRLVRGACAAGARREDLLRAVEVARSLADVPAWMVVQVLWTIDAVRPDYPVMLAPQPSAEAA